VALVEVVAADQAVEVALVEVVAADQAVEVALVEVVAAVANPLLAQNLPANPKLVLLAAGANPLLAQNLPAAVQKVLLTQSLIRRTWLTAKMRPISMRPI